MGKDKLFKRVIKQIIISVLISVFIYFGIITFFMMSGIPKRSKDNKLNFNELKIDYSDMPELKSFKARDDNSLKYRYYPSKSNNVLILIHGAAWHSQYFYSISEYISKEDLAHIYTPDLRGHGKSPKRRGDIDYIDQLEDDLADFIEIIKKEHPDKKIILGGHSSGGGLVIRFGGSGYRKMIDAYILLSPFIKYNAPTIKPNSGGFAIAYSNRIAGLTMLNNVGISFLNGMDVISFNMPEDVRNGSETLFYSYRLNTGLAPENYQKELKEISQELLVVVGEADESFYAEEFEPLITKYSKNSNVELLPGVTHMGIIMGKEIRPIIKNWLIKLN